MAAVLPATGGSRQPAYPTPIPVPAQGQAPAPALAPPMPSPVVAPAPAPVPPYKALIEDYDPQHKDWYVVVVGRRVGVFRTA